MQDEVKKARDEFNKIRTLVSSSMGKILKALEGTSGGGSAPSPSPSPTPPSPGPKPTPKPTPKPSPVTGGGYTYIWLVPTKVRDPYVQLADVKFKSNGKDVKPTSAENAPGGSSPGHESPGKAIDGNKRTKWLGRNKVGLIFKFGSPVNLNAWTYITANDVPGRDIQQFEMKGSNDKKSWKTIFKRTSDIKVTSARYAEVPWIPLEPLKKAGSSCDQDMQCETALCKNSKCSTPSAEGSACSRKEECSTGFCEGGKCVKPKGVQIRARGCKQCIAQQGGDAVYKACNKGDGSQLWSKTGSGEYANAQTGKCIVEGRYAC